MICLFHCLTDSTWVAVNWAEIAEQLGSIVEFQEYSKQKIVSDHHGHPVWLVVLIPPAARVAYVAAVATAGVPVVQNPWGGGLGISESEFPAIELVNGRVYGLARYIFIVK